MAMTVQQIVAEAKKLTPAEQAELVDLLWIEAVGGPDPSIEEEWRQEARRRVDDIVTGREAGVPGEQVMAEIRKIVGR